MAHASCAAMDEAPPIYGDPFDGVCRHALALAPERRAQATLACQRCGPAGDAAAGCLLEGLDLAIRALPPR